jgi:hypothetical protein
MIASIFFAPILALKLLGDISFTVFKSPNLLNNNRSVNIEQWLNRNTPKTKLPNAKPFLSPQASAAFA